MDRWNSSRTSFARRISTAVSTAALTVAILSLPSSMHAQAQQEGSSSAEYVSRLSAAPSSPASADAGSAEARGSASLLEPNPAPNAQYGGQYGHRGPYGRSQQRYPYHGLQSRIAIEAGGGFTAPVQDSERDMTYGWNVTGGVGYKFAPNVAVMGEYQFIRSGIPNAVLSAVGEPGGNIHTWSLTLDPVVSYKTTGRWGGYVTGGGGFYRRLTSFTEPVQAIGVYCDYFSCYPYYFTENVVVSHYSSNQGGLNIGTGLTFGGWNTGKFYAEARYTWLDTPGHATEMVPVTFGFRW